MSIDRFSETKNEFNVALGIKLYEKIQFRILWKSLASFWAWDIALIFARFESNQGI